LQARAELGTDDMDDLLSAPRMVLQQFIDKWFPNEEELPSISQKRLNKLLLDVSGRAELRPVARLCSLTAVP